MCFILSCCVVIFKVYDSDGNGKVTFNDMLDVLHDLTGHFVSQQQREVRLQPSFGSVFILFGCV